MDNGTWEYFRKKEDKPLHWTFKALIVITIALLIVAVIITIKYPAPPGAGYSIFRDII